MALNIGNKVYRNLQEQVGYNSEQIDKIFSILDGIDYEDHVVVIEDISTPLTEDELAIVNEPVAFLVYQDKLYFKDRFDSPKIYFSAVIDINDSGEITFSSYQISVDSVTGEMEVINTTSEVYSTDEVDDKISGLENLILNIPSGSPKGVYSTLADLQTAYPTGTEGIFVVSANGHWYYWNGNAWSDGGLYQAIANNDLIMQAKAFVNDYSYSSTLTDANNVTDTITYEIAITQYAVISNLPQELGANPSCRLETYKQYYQPSNIYVYVQVLTDYKTGKVYRRAKIANWSAWKLCKTNNEIYISSSDTPTDFYTKMKQAFLQGNVNVYIDGAFDISSIIETIHSEYANGIPVGANNKYYFTTQSKITANYRGSDDNVRKDFSIFYANGSFELNGLNAEGSNIRYIVHDEEGGSQANSYRHIYKSCYMTIDNTNYHSVSSTFHCIGGGLGVNSYIEIDGCYFNSVYTPSTNLSDVQYHGNWDTTQTQSKSKLLIKDSYFEHSLAVSTPDPETEKKKVIVTNNSFGNSLVYNGTSDTYWDVYKWNNEIRGS